MDEHKPILSYDIRSAMEVSQNPYQGDYKRVLCVCSAGVLRSATTAVVLSQEPFNYNTRSAGVEYYALIPVTKVLLNWADEIVCMTKQQKRQLEAMTDKVILCLNVSDSYAYRDSKLEALIYSRYEKCSKKTISME